MKKNHIAIINVAAHGHVNPTLPVAEELVKRGHRVTYATTEDFAQAVSKTGAVPVLYRTSIKPDPKTIKEQVNKSDAFVMFLKEAADVLPQLEELYKDDLPDAVLYDFLALSGRLFSDKCGIPAVKFCPSYAMNEHFQIKKDKDTLEAAKKAIEEFQEEVENEQLKHMTMEEFFKSEKLNIVFMPRAFQPKQETFDDSFCFAGPSLGERTNTGSLELEEADDRPLMLISLGTAFNAWPEFYQMCIDAFRDSEWRVVMSVGTSIEPESFTDVPDHFIIRQHVPQLDVLEKAQLFVSHGGMNSTMEAMNAGVPLVVVPQMEEQEITAMRVDELGLGVHLPPKEVSVSRLQKDVQKVYQDKNILSRVKNMQQKIEETGGAKQAAAAIEDFIKEAVVEN